MPKEKLSTTPSLDKETSTDSEVGQVIRPTKKQQELLEYIRLFVLEHGYGPSYREIMNGCNYTSVATVAVHIRNLIARGHLRKKGRSARSLEIVGEEIPVKLTKLPSNQIKPAEERWLVEKIEYMFKQLNDAQDISGQQIADLEVVIQALKVLGIEGANLQFSRQLKDIKARLVEE
jgi:SOS-response transcriptional repressor LexA